MEQRLTTKVILPDGPASAELIFVGEAPGAQEDDVGKPFVGSAGQLFNRCLNQVAIIRSDCLIGNVFQQRPPRNNVNHYFLNKTNTKLTWEGEEHVARLKAWLEEVKQMMLLEANPKLVVALGATAMFILTGRKRINKWRGSVLPCTLVEGLHVYPAFHPSYVNRLMNESGRVVSKEKTKDAQNVLPLFILDLERARDWVQAEGKVTQTRKFETDLPFHEIEARLKYYSTAKYVDNVTLSIDIETLPDETGPILWCIGFAATPYNAFTVPFLRGMKFCWTIEEEAKLMVLISEVFLNPHIKKVFQNGCYDLSVLGRYYGLRLANNTYEDTMWCHHASYPYIKKGLETLTSIYTWEPYYKDEGKVNFGKRGGDLAEFIYNAKDCCVTREIFPIVEREANKLSTYKGYRRTISVIPSLLGMMLRGVLVDQDKKKNLQKDFQEKVNYYSSRTNELVGKEINLNSSTQKKELLYVIKNYPIQTNIKTGKATTDKDAIQRLKKMFPNDEVLTCILEYQKYAKLVSTYTSMEVDTDGRIHTSYGFVSTWRLSSSESHFGGGGNLQNIPKRTTEGKMIRKLFVPDPGLTMLSVDLSQAEARVVAYEANNIPLIEAFSDPSKDVHWENAKRVFNLPETLEYFPNGNFKDNITKQEHTLDEYRNIGKTIKHATNYGMGWMMLQTILAREGFIFPAAVCKRFLQQTIATDPAGEEWKRGIREKIKASRMLVSSFGRKRYFMGRMGDSLFRAAYAFSPQNTVGELTQVGTREVWKKVPEVACLMNVHDELVMQLKPELRDEVIPKIRECFSIPLMINNRELIIPCEFKSGHSWGDLVELEV